MEKEKIRKRIRKKILEKVFKRREREFPYNK
jgi:hypothetical protein